MMTTIELRSPFASVSFGESFEDMMGGLLVTSDMNPEAEALEPRVAVCPVCKAAAPYPETSSAGVPFLAECERCDVYFDVNPAERFMR